MKWSDKQEKEKILEGFLDPMLDVFIQKQAEDPEQQERLSDSKETYLQEQRALMKETIREEIALLQETMQKAGELLYQKMEFLPLQEKTQIVEELQTAFGTMSTLGGESEMVSLQEKIALSDTTLLWVYKIGYDCFAAEDFRGANAIFQLLVILSGMISDYWIALGLSQRRLGWKDKALGSFLMADNLHPSHPAIKCNLTELYCEMGISNKAKFYFEDFVRLTEMELYADLRDVVEELRQKIAVI